MKLITNLVITIFILVVLIIGLLVFILIKEKTNDQSFAIPENTEKLFENEKNKDNNASVPKEKANEHTIVIESNIEEPYKNKSYKDNKIALPNEDATDYFKMFEEIKRIENIKQRVQNNIPIHEDEKMRMTTHEFVALESEIVKKQLLKNAWNLYKLNKISHYDYTDIRKDIDEYTIGLGNLLFEARITSKYSDEIYKQLISSIEK
ncbi:hypothetical protein LJC57_00890 [Parabacteroides sp. OttesenSCG-928-G07]|nr:hypothetical protein [Parabacteroides sp. OttesenSCG-928-G21]MDL2277125.1 hypothetical protein [Parabacteroides sp. OttesenSCG-928-G07]